MVGDNKSLPTGWQWYKAGNVIDVRDGTHDSPKYQPTGIPLVTSKNLVNGAIDFSTCTFISDEDHAAISKRSAVSNGDILYAMIGTIGNPVIVKKEFEFSIKNVALFKFGNDNVYNRYIYHYLKSNIVERQFSKNARGGTQKFVSLGNIRDLLIPLPPLEEQKRIATILDKADTLRRKRQQAIDLTEQLLRSVFLDMFGDLNDFPMVKIKEIAAKTKYSLSSGPFGSNLTSKHYEPDGVIVLRGTNVTSGWLNLDNVKYISKDKAEELKRSKVCPDDIVIVAVGSSGHAFKIPKSLSFAVMSQNFNKVTPNKDKVTPIYLEYCFNSPLVQRQFKQNITDTVRTFLSLTKIKEVKIPLPPLEDQVHFENIVDQLHTHKTKLENTLQEAEVLFSSLTQQAFRGELTKQTEAA